MKRFSVLFLAVCSVQAALAGDPPQKINIENMPAAIVDTVIVPVPTEVFGVLDKLGNPNWHAVLREINSTPRGERAQVALLLGSVIAEGFIAVEAQESEEVKKIGRGVLKLSAAIGVQQSVKSRSNAIIEAAGKKAWDTVRRELDGAQQDVKQAMLELNDEQLAQLVSLGGWLRGTEALTSIVSKNYSKDGAELLNQPALLEYFIRRLEEMDPRSKENPVVTKIRQRLPEIRPLIAGEDNDISKAEVDRVQEIVSDLNKAIISNGE